ncbi:hypothetical protein Pan258_15930 [Symmachiella dynata]|uniref:hypothetical protein n=1 Tax=Symmachiella dynata TaxID=2527995 RepID=UPI00118D42A1|nr:hypothetical protein [Symmachiella dynata]QDT47557.1 hypothetical protein Pan258_15930 [Symmachiella dynata]
MDVSIPELVENTSALRPHVVILGAGASRAAFLKGDANGNVIPLMNDLLDVLRLDEELKQLGVDTSSQNFETVYGSLSGHVKYQSISELIESRVRDYFAALSLPRMPTLYDHLLLSLRPHDMVATFNWDPFLFDAWERNSHIAGLPHLVFLHGNVRVGCCLEHKFKGRVGDICPDCRTPHPPSELLFPVERKGYTSNGFIEDEWNRLKIALGDACMFTIFGYSAPASDVEAVSLMQTAWRTAEERSMEQIEIIDIASEEDLCKSWDSFIFSHHYHVRRNFYDSWIAQFPRRTGEAYFDTFYDGKYVSPNPIPPNLDFQNLKKWIAPLTSAEGFATKSISRQSYF